jgi:hypothetical protein
MFTGTSYDVRPVVFAVIAVRICETVSIAAAMRVVSAIDYRPFMT